MASGNKVSPKHRIPKGKRDGSAFLVMPAGAHLPINDAPVPMETTYADQQVPHVRLPRTLSRGDPNSIIRCKSFSVHCGFYKEAHISTARLSQRPKRFYDCPRPCCHAKMHLATGSWPCWHASPSTAHTAAMVGEFSVANVTDHSLPTVQITGSCTAWVASSVLPETRHTGMCRLPGPQQQTSAAQRIIASVCDAV